MQELLILSLCASLALSHSMAIAGGPVIVEEEALPEVVEQAPPRSGWIGPVVIGVLFLCAIACGGSDDSGGGTPPPDGDGDDGSGGDS